MLGPTPPGLSIPEPVLFPPSLPVTFDWRKSNGIITTQKAFVMRESDPADPGSHCPLGAQGDAHPPAPRRKDSLLPAGRGARPVPKTMVLHPGS